MTSPFTAVPVDELYKTSNAAVWAATFCQLLRDKPHLDPTDEGWLVGWFANAMAAEEMDLRRRGKLIDSPRADSGQFSDAEDIPSLFYELAGFGSACWEHVERAGVFESERAKAGAEAAIARLHEIADVHAYTGEVAQGSGN